ncbi:MAG: outer rane efflux protein [Candidatus Angelobacter sp.]|nr:outer rane efflux protein [Candidatus Angelobacter sp.]
MRVLRHMVTTSKNLLVLATTFTLVFPASVFAQDAPTAPSATKTPATQRSLVDFTKPNLHFPNPLGPYKAHQVQEPDFSNTPRIDQLIKNGELVLSLNDAIALTLENNLDLAIARYNLNIADTDILRAKAGNSIRGVATGLVTGTPGGGQGGFGTGASGAGAGGTTGGAGGAGAGSSGLVQSTLGATGPAVPQFDPSLTSSLQIEHAVFPQSNTITTGVPILQQNSGTANFAYNQGFAPGTNVSVGFNNSRLTTNSLGSFLNPSLNSSFRFTLQQHLLQGFGIALNKRNIYIANNNRNISTQAFRNQVISTVSQIQNIYWDLVNAYEDVKVKQRSLSLAEKTESDNRKQVEIGTLAPIEIVRADSEVATRRQDLIISQTNLQLQQALIKNALTRNLSDPLLATIPVIPTDTMVLPKEEPITPVQDLVKHAIEKRPDLEQSRIDLVNRDISKKAAKNSLLPAVDLVAFYGGSGLAGSQNPLRTCAAATCTQAELDAGRLAPGTVGAAGFGDSFGSLFDSSAPDKGVGLQITIPIRNRSAQADQIRSELELRQAQLRYLQQQNQVGIDVRNAQFALQQNRARVDAAISGRQLAQESLDAEQKKYTLGASTNILVLQAQRDLAVSESNVVAAMAAYEKSRVALDQVTGDTLTKLGIVLNDAEAGVVKQTPQVPDVVTATPTNK